MHVLADLHVINVVKDLNLIDFPDLHVINVVEGLGVDEDAKAVGLADLRADLDVVLRLKHII